MGNLKAYDEKNGSSIAADSERLAREMCGEEENWEPIPPRVPQAAIADGPQGNEKSLRALAEEMPGLDLEGARVRDEIIHTGSRIFVSRVGHCGSIPGATVTHRKRPRAARCPVSRRAKMEMYVACGFFRKVRNDYIPVLPANEYQPVGPIGKLDGNVETPNNQALGCVAMDSVLRENLCAIKNARGHLMRDENAAAGSAATSDVAPHVEFLRRTTGLLEAYLRAAEAASGQVIVKYEYKTPLGGRRYAQGGIAAQALLRDIREVALRGVAVDIDMVNAFPSLLAQLAAKLCGEEYARAMAPVIFEYNANREAILRRINLWMGGGRRQAKQLVLRVLNGGGVPGFFRTAERAQIGNKSLLPPPRQDSPPFVRDLKKAGRSCARLAEQVWPALADLFAERNRPDLTALHYVVASIEDTALAAVEQFLGKNEYQINPLHFDGLLVRTQDRRTLDALLEDMQRHVAKEAGYSLEFAIKYWEGGFFGRLPSQLEFSSDTGAARFELCGNCVVASAVAVCLSGSATPSGFADECRLMERLCSKHAGTQGAGEEQAEAVSYGAVAAQMWERHRAYIKPTFCCELLARLSQGVGALLHHGQHCVGLRCGQESRLVGVFDTANGSVGAATLGALSAFLADAPGAYRVQPFLCIPANGGPPGPPTYEPWEVAALGMKASGAEDEEDACNPTEDLLSNLVLEKTNFERSVQRAKGGGGETVRLPTVPEPHLLSKKESRFPR